MGAMRNPLRKVSLSYFVCITLIVVLLASSLWMLAVLLTSGHNEKLQAERDGRIVEVGLNSGGSAERIPETAPSVPYPESSAAAAKDAPPVEPMPVVAALPPPAPSSPPAGIALPNAPADFITENTELGHLPRISKEGEKPWRYYGREPAADAKAPRVAILIVGLGLSRELTDQALRLPPEISFTLSAYAPDVAVWAAAARAWGHELFVELPLEPLNYPANDPGPQGLISQLPVQENNKRLRWALTRFPGYAGVFFSPDERFTHSKDAVEPLLHFLNARGLMVAAATAKPSDSLKEAAKQTGLPILYAEHIVEEDASDHTLGIQLLEMENIARRTGQVLTVIPASPAALAAVAKWSQVAKNKGFYMVPVSTLARLKFS